MCNYSAKVVGMAMLATLISCSDHTSSSSSQKQASSYAAASSKKWYEGGTLHNQTGLDWQSASVKNKLATCADLVYAAWKFGYLKDWITNKLTSRDDMLPYAMELVNCLDAAFVPDPDPARNRAAFGNITVNEAAAICMARMKWTK